LHDDWQAQRIAGVIRLSLLNLMRSPRRTILTILDVAVSVFVLSVLLSLPGIADRVLKDRASSLRVITHSKAGPLYVLPESYGSRIGSRPHVQALSAFTLFLGIYHLPTDQFPNAAVDHEQVETMWPDWGISSAEAKEFKRSRTACLVGPALMQRFHWHTGQQIMLRGTIYPVDLTFQIAGELGDKAPPPILLFRRDYLEEATGHRAQVNMYMVKVDESRAIPSVIDDIDRMFANSGADTRTETEFAFFSNVLGNFRALFAITKVIALIVALTITLVAANAAAMSIRERRSEIAIMRALGFRASTLLTSLLAEGAIVGLVGGIVGIGAAYAVLRWLSVGSAALGPLGLALRVPPVVMFETLTIALVVGALSGLVPALTAVRRNIVEAIRNLG
jgi:putative ABC transport system permease protein